MEQSIDSLVAQCPELKLVKKTATRTTHFKDVQDGSKHPVGHVEHMEYWTNDSGYVWGRADIMLYIKSCEAYDKAKNPTIDEEINNLISGKSTPRRVTGTLSKNLS
jgi:hypothetical protein